MTLEEIGKLKESGEYITLALGYSEALRRDITQDDLDSTKEDRRAYVAALARKQSEEAAAHAQAAYLAHVAGEQLTAALEPFELPPPAKPENLMGRMRNAYRRLMGRPDQSDVAGLRVKHTMVLKKFEGDEQTGEPLETIYIEDGRIVKRIVKGEK